MKALRAILLVGGLGLIVLGILDYVAEVPGQEDQALPKIILGLLAIAASWMSKRYQ